MGGGLHLFINPGDFAVPVDDVGYSRDSPILPSIHALFLPRAVLLTHLVVHIGKQREIQIVLCGELLMGLLTVGRDSEHDGAEFLNRADVVSKCTSLDRAARRKVFRVKVQNYFFAFKVRKLDLFAVAVVQRELWSLVSN